MLYVQPPLEMLHGSLPAALRVRLDEIADARRSGLLWGFIVGLIVGAGLLLALEGL